MKRKAEFDLDRKNLEKDDSEYLEQNNRLKENLGKIQTPEEIAKRRFLKIKGLKPHLDEENSSKKPFFHLEKPLETKFVETKNQFSFIQNPEPLPQKTNIFSEKANENEKIQKKNESPEPLIKIPFEKNTNIFNIENNAEKKNEKNLERSPEKTNNNIFNEKPTNDKTNENQANNHIDIQKEQLKDPEIEPTIAKGQEEPPNNFVPTPNEEKNVEHFKPVASFGFKIDNPLSFSNPLQSKSKEEQPESQPSSLFNVSNTNISNKPIFFGVPNNTSIFGSANASIIQQPSQSLFGNAPQNIFGNISTTAIGNPSAGNLFGNLQPNLLFGNNSKLNEGKPSGMFINTNNQKNSDDESDGNEEGEKEPDSPEIDQTKSSGNFQYEEFSEKICSKKINKFKVNEKDALESGSVSLEKIKGQESWFVCYRNQAKLMMYRGWALKKLSATGTINKRLDSMTLTLFSEQKELKEQKEKKEQEEQKEEKEQKEQKSKLSKDICKIMFLSQNDCEEFKKEIEKIIIQ